MRDADEQGAAGFDRRCARPAIRDILGDETKGQKIAQGFFQTGMVGARPRRPLSADESDAEMLFDELSVLWISAVRDNCRWECSAWRIKDFTMKRSGLTCGIAIVLSAIPAAAALAGSTYDGAWNLVFVTQRGACDPNYSFGINIANGIVSHPNLVRFTGRVTINGLVHASVTVQDKYAVGSGRLTKTSGQGTWKGRS